jgi:hypothetical protein
MGTTEATGSETTDEATHAVRLAMHEQASVRRGAAAAAEGQSGFLSLDPGAVLAAVVAERCSTRQRQLEVLERRLERLREYRGLV